ncbi:MAG: flavodoxin reductase, partial [Gammaproteobacteria bacterium]
AFGERALFLVDRDASPGFEAGRVDANLLKRRIDDWQQHFYVCGPPPFNDAVMQTLRQLGAKPEALVFEK